MFAARMECSCKARYAEWEVICNNATQENLWSVEWFEGKLYIATIRALYTLADNAFVSVDFGDDLPTSCYRLLKSRGFL